LTWPAIGKLEGVGQVDAGDVWKYPTQTQQGEKTLPLRPIVLRFAKPNRHEN